MILPGVNNECQHCPVWLGQLWEVVHPLTAEPLVSPQDIITACCPFSLLVVNPLWPFVWSNMRNELCAWTIVQHRKDPGEMWSGMGLQPSEYGTIWNPFQKGWVMVPKYNSYPLSVFGITHIKTPLTLADSGLAHFRNHQENHIKSELGEILRTHLILIHTSRQNGAGSKTHFWDNEPVEGVAGHFTTYHLS